MDIRQLQYFTAVVDNGTISEAARKLHISQPPLSTQIKSLEAECGVTLFERGARHITLTEAGRLLYRHAVQILSMEKAAEAEMQNLRTGKQGSIRIGLISSCASKELFDGIQTFHRHYPGVVFDVLESNTFDLLAQLDNSRIELAVIRTPYHRQDLEALTLRKDPFAAVATSALFANHLKSQSKIKIEDLRDCPLILYRRWENAIRQVFQQAQIVPNIICINDDARTSLQWAASGIGVALVPLSIATSFSNLKAAPLETPALDSELRLVRRKNAPISQNAYHFFELFEAQNKKRS
jgi:DNA-binding transcriptional LysR family regulator